MNPPKAKPAFWVPAPASPHLAVIKSPPDDHDVPLYSSVHAQRLLKRSPPKAKASFWVPAPARSCLPVINAPPAIQVPGSGVGVGVTEGVTVLVGVTVAVGVGV